MMSLSRARKILGKKYSHLTNEEIEMLLTKTYPLADMVTNLIAKKVFESRVRIIDSEKGRTDD